MRILFFVLTFILVVSAITSAKGADTNTVSSTVVTNNTPPTANAPSVVVNNSDICKTAASTAVQTQILGISSGETVRDPNCERLKISKTLYDMGMKVAAVSVLCQDRRVWDAMEMAGTPCPFLGEIGSKATAQWVGSILTECASLIEGNVSDWGPYDPLLHPDLNSGGPSGSNCRKLHSFRGSSQYESHGR